MKFISFKIQIQKPEETIAFYTQVLGMHLEETFETNTTIIYQLKFKAQDFHLELVYKKNNSKPETYQQKWDDNYWKFSIFVNNIQRVSDLITKQGIPIKKPFQFNDIGYLAHTQDLEQHQIEFIQKTFKQNTPITQPNYKLPLQETPLTGLLTIRTIDPIKSIQFYETIFDMKLLVRMYVERENGFTLYFLGDKTLNPPSKDIDAIENREWMYQQNKPFIEIQYYWNSEYNQSLQLKKNRLGLQSIVFEENYETAIEKLENHAVEFKQESILGTTKKIIKLTSIDNHNIEIISRNNNNLI